MDQGKCATGMMKKLEQGQSAQSPFRKEDGGGGSLPVRIVCNTSQGVVPCQECREQREKATGLDDRWVRRTGCVAV